MYAKSTSSNVERAADILLALGDAPAEGLPLAEIVARVGGAKPPVHRALVALSGRGFVEPGPRRGAYRLGPAIHALSRSGPPDAAVARWKPVLVAVAARTGQSTYLMARAGLDAVCLDVEAGSGPIQTLTSGVGGRVPLGIGPGGLAILALLPDDVRAVIIENNRERYQRDGRVTAETVRTALGDIARTGVAVDEGALIPGVAGLAVPIQDPQLGPVAISQAMPVTSLSSAAVDGFTTVLDAALADGRVPDGLAPARFAPLS